MLKILLNLVFIIVSMPHLYALECPRKMSVEVDGLSTFSSDDATIINYLYEFGEKQFSKEYIATVLDIATRLRTSKINLSYNQVESVNNRCIYLGKDARLTLTQAGSRFKFRLTVGKINYYSKNKTNPLQHKGLAIDIINTNDDLYRGKLTSFSSEGRVSVNLYVQKNLGKISPNDYVVEAKIGKAHTVSYYIED